MTDRIIAIVGIHTGIGKTIVSAVLAEALNADYWKPVQAGIEERDVITVQGLVTNGNKRIFKEAVLLKAPLSPHAAAALEGIEIDYKNFEFPITENILLVETAGGVMSPISSHKTMADFVKHFNLPVILVVNNYLGSINHSLLSLEVLKNRSIKILGIVVTGKENIDSESFIESYNDVPIIVRIPEITDICHTSIVSCANKINKGLVNLLQL